MAAEAFVLNRTEILERLGGDEEILNVMLDMFVEDVENNCSALANAMAKGDAKALHHESHTVKGLLATVSDDAGAADAYVIEKQAKAGDISGLNDAVAALQQRLRDVAVVLNKELGR